MYDFDKGLRHNYVPLLCGVDEAGRGPLAGPVSVAAVILPEDARFEGLNDSKKLTEATRERLYGEITKTALAWSVVMIDEKTIDEINILEATMEGMKQAVSALSCCPNHILIDGNRRPRFEPFIRSDILPKADARSASVAAASVLAKVSRDRLMVRLAEEFPEYGFEKHKGYPTKQHYQALET
ncbi:MAG: ribonuclease HII, partial [Clostridia bacterium]|nr:ribonuclease HII [Clostridia bacterium]